MERGISLKFDILEQFREHLNDSEDIRHETANTYYNAVKGLLKGSQFDDVSEIDSRMLEQEIAVLATKSRVSAAKNGLKKFKQVFPTLKIPDDEFFKKVMKSKSNRRLTRKEEMKLDSVRRKINAISNKKMKLAYRTALATGLRVSEIGNLRKEDFTFTEEGLNVYVSDGKGGKTGTVKALNDEYLTTELKEYLKDLENSEKVFYSAGYLKEKANELGFECHDLRRAFSQMVYKEERAADKDPLEAKKEVQKALRHSRYSTTKRYLSRKISFKGVKRYERKQ